MQHPLVQIPLVYLVPSPIIPLSIYTTRGYTSINNVMILFHISIAKSQLHKQCLEVSTRYIQKGHILSALPFHQPLIGITLWTNNQRKETIFLLIFMPHNHFQTFFLKLTDFNNYSYYNQMSDSEMFWSKACLTKCSFMMMLNLWANLLFHDSVI